MMKSGLEKRLSLYRKILKREQKLYDASEHLYRSYNEKEDPLAVVSIYVMAPVMFQFVSWVLQKAIQAGHKRLYFLARDGYSMYRIASIICKSSGLPVECKYLYCSRYAWRSAEYCLLGEDSLHYIGLGGIEVTFEKMMHRAGIKEEEIAEIAEQIGYQERKRDVLPYKEREELKDKLTGCPVFMEAMMRHSKENYPKVIGYLKQEGLFDNLSYAIVDSGWTGSMQKSLNNLIRSGGYDGRIIEGYYFGMYEYPLNADEGLYHTYFFGPNGKIRRKVYFCNSLFECIFSSPEGMVTGYQRKQSIPRKRGIQGKIEAKHSTEERNSGETFIPVLERQDNPNRNKIRKSTDYLCAYAEYMVKNIQNTSYELPGLNKITLPLLYNFMGHPTIVEAEAFGTYIFCDDVIGEGNQTVAAPLTYKELRENRVWDRSLQMLSKAKAVKHESAWIEGSTVLQIEATNADLRQAALYKYALYWRKSMKRGN